MLRKRLLNNKTNVEKFAKISSCLALVKSNQRYQLLAYGFLRGLKYKQLERTCNEKVFGSYLLEVVNQFAFQAYKLEQVRAWLEESL